MVVERLAPIIHQILSAPDTDLSTVSAKRVRKQLAELDPDITLEFIKQNKDAIDSLIGSIFESLNNPDTDADFRENPPHVSVNGNGKRKREGNGREMKAKREDSQGEDERATEEDEDQPDSPSLAIPVTKKAKKASAQALTDEEYARQLSSEINQRPSRGSRKANGSKKGASRTPKKKKSRAQIEDSDEDEEAGSRSKGPKKKSGGGAKGGFAKEYALRSVFSSKVLVFIKIYCTYVGRLK